MNEDVIEIPVDFGTGKWFWEIPFSRVYTAQFISETKNDSRFSPKILKKIRRIFKNLNHAWHANDHRRHRKWELAAYRYVDAINCIRGGKA